MLNIPRCSEFLELTRRSVRAALRHTAGGKAVFNPSTKDFYGRTTFLLDFVWLSKPGIGCVSADELRDSLGIFLQCVQQDKTVWRAFNYGTMEPEGWSVGRPNLDSGILLVLGFHNYYTVSRDLGFYGNQRGLLLEILSKIPRCPDTGLVWVEPGVPQTSYGFTDNVYRPGRELMCSLMLREAYLALGAMESACGGENAALCSAEADRIRQGLKVLWDERGWFRAYDGGENPPPDLWGTAYAVYTNAVDQETQERIADWLQSLLYSDLHRPERLLHRANEQRIRIGFKPLEGEAGLREAALIYTQLDPVGYNFCNGFVRHLPAPYFWEHITVPPASEHFYYQNGWYWSVATGWTACALKDKYPESAEYLFNRMIDWTLENGVWEAIYLNGERRGEGLLSSLVCPAEALVSCA